VHPTRRLKSVVASDKLFFEETVLEQVLTYYLQSN
jgi:hypothetical protein